jgi:sugar O-acyltransferase (sialic acid O-acetyltransferase NeuD family)
MEEIFVPLLNANEPEARVVDIYVNELQLVKTGERILTLETTKATVDIEASRSGYIHISVGKDEIVRVDTRIGWITDNPDDIIPKVHKEDKLKTNGIRITDPARELALQLGIDFSELPTDKVITTSMIRSMVEKPFQVLIPENIDPKRAILVYGGGGHAKSVIDMIRSYGLYDVVGIIDDNIPQGKEVAGIPVLGSRTALKILHDSGINFAANSVGGIIDINIRIRIYKLLKEEYFRIPVIEHPSAVIEKSAKIGEGVQIFANAYVGSETSINENVIINNNAVVSHDCTIGAHSHIAPGCLLAGIVQIGNSSLIGMGVTTAIGIKIGNNCRIGNGAIISADVPDNTIVPGGRIWTGN